MPVRAFLAALCAVLLSSCAPVEVRGGAAATQRRPVQGIHQGNLPGGARWLAEIPANWNGTLLVWSHGYSPRIDPPEVAPATLREPLLGQGYGLLASDFGAGGWSLEQAVPSQRAAVAAFRATVARPRRVLAWGTSMGGLITTALAEQRRPVIDGGLALCPSIGGAVGMMNMALDGAFAFRMLQAPDAGIELVNVSDDMANARRAQQALALAQQSPQGRARISLAGVLAGLPGWTRPDRPQPAPADIEARISEIAAHFVMGVFLPRSDQERRAGGAFSWNDGIDYREQLRLSEREAFVRAAYARAGLDLDADLAALQRAPRITARRDAVAYMKANYTPTARPSVPLLTMQAIGDGLTSPSLQRDYVDAASPRMVAGIWLDAAGHCTFTSAQVVAALARLGHRVDRGNWPALPTVPGSIDAPGIAPMLRPCRVGGPCR